MLREINLNFAHKSKHIEILNVLLMTLLGESQFESRNA